MIQQIDLNKAVKSIPLHWKKNLVLLLGNTDCDPCTNFRPQRKLFSNTIKKIKERSVALRQGPRVCCKAI